MNDFLEGMKGVASAVTGGLKDFYKSKAEISRMKWQTRLEQARAEAAFRREQADLARPLDVYGPRTATEPGPLLFLPPTGQAGSGSGSGPVIVGGGGAPPAGVDSTALLVVAGLVALALMVR